jgi:hypothetical protein
MMARNMPRIRLRLLALFTALLLALPAAGMFGPRWFCSMMGRVMSSSCGCSSEPAAEAPHEPQGPQLESSDCCSRLEPGHGAGVALRELSAGVASLALPHVDTLKPLVPRASELAKQRQPVAARAPPSTGPPLFLENCSILS